MKLSAKRQIADNFNGEPEGAKAQMADPNPEN